MGFPWCVAEEIYLFNKLNKLWYFVGAAARLTSRIVTAIRGAVVVPGTPLQTVRNRKPENCRSWRRAAFKRW
jgi:hypothetical protein